MNLTDLISAWSGLAALGPALLLAALLLPSKTANRHGREWAQTIAWLALGVFGLGVVLFAFVLANGLTLTPTVQIGSFPVGLYLDALTAVMFLLVSFLGVVVTRYAVNYLDGDPRQGHFSKWLAVTIGSVLTVIIAGNLLLFTAAWVATSLSLHQLLTFYHERPAAILAARKKFLISRLGDACLLGALGLTWYCLGTWQFTAMFAAVEEVRTEGGVHAACLGWCSLLLVAGAMLKSAQFPFHSWLPDTMETPTPVSALMHAGIINAGGFLVIRLSPLVTASPAALNGLAIVGAFTALFASVVMLTQTSVKRSLAYSTISQMGFMMLQCGLGAFALATLHLVAHSLYKAHAFLSSGSVVALSKSAWVPTDKPASHPFVIFATLGAAAALTWAVGAAFGIHFTKDPGVLLLGVIYLMALAYLMWNLWARTHGPAIIGWGLLLGGGASAAYFALHAMFEWLLAPSLPTYAPTREPWEFAVMILIGLLFMGVLVFQSQLPSWSSTRWGKALYVQVSQGFYLGLLANRFTRAIFGKSTTT